MPINYIKSDFFSDIHSTIKGSLSSVLLIAGVVGLCASEALAQTGIIEEVVVSAQKRNQSLQKVDVAVTAVSGDRISNDLIANIEDLQTLAPNISAGNDFDQAKFFIRGIGLSNSFTGVDPSVAMHVDDALISQAHAQLASFFDLERIEVIRGPQGTVYGRNNTGGSINLITKKPTEEFEGYVNATLGTYNWTLIEAAVGGPLTDKLLGRIAVRSDTRDGYGENIANGQDIDNANKRSARFHLQFDASDDVDFLLTGEVSKADDASLALKFLREAFPGTTDPALIATGINQITGNRGYASDPRDVNSETHYINEKLTWSITGTLDWQLSENLSLKSITNYRHFDVLDQWDLDISIEPNDDVFGENFDSDHYSEELQLQYQGERFNVMVAGYYFAEELLYKLSIGCNTPLDDFTTDCIGSNGRSFGNNIDFRTNGDQDITAKALFANASYDLTDQLTIKVGGRYSDESRDSINSTTFAAEVRDSRSFTDFSPSFAINWNPSDDILLYASYNEGFKSGTAQLGVPSSLIIDPEQAQSFEVGLKSTLLNDSLRLNIAAFSAEVEDLQVSRTVARDNNAGFVTNFENAGLIETQGLEVEYTWHATEQLTFDGYVSWLDAEIKDFATDSPLTSTTIIENLEGNRPRQSPELSYNFRTRYEIGLKSEASVIFGGEVSFKDDQFYSEFNDPILGQDSYTIVNANIRYVSPNQQFSVNVWGKNLSDELVTSGVFALGGARTLGRTFLAPRTVGVSLGYKF